MSRWLDLVLSCSPFPVADLESGVLPSSGISVHLPGFCEKKFSGGPECREHYKVLRKHIGKPIQCPFGFTSVALMLDDRQFAFTGLIPFPRMGGSRESQRAKEAPQSRVDMRSVLQWIDTAREALEFAVDRDAAELAKNLEALHEVRRFNQIAVTVLERLCNRQSPGNPDGADVDLVRAWKASQLITLQMDALDVISNPSLLGRDKMAPYVLYRQIDKIVRIYKPEAEKKNVQLRLSGSSDCSVHLDRNTFHVLPSVLIDNAIKYSPAGGQVSVCVSENGSEPERSVGFSVESIGPSSAKEEESLLFERKYRGKGAKGKPGGGIGLFIARMIAEQHGGRLICSQCKGSDGQSSWTFEYEMEAK